MPVVKYLLGATNNGEFGNRTKDGKGVYVWLNGYAYFGTFIDDARPGEGIYTHLEHAQLVKKAVVRHSRQTNLIVIQTAGHITY